MPTYEYECQICGHIFERFQSMTASPVKRCPKCKGKVRRMLGTGAGIIFKGSGFYATDYKKTTPSHKEKVAPDEGKKHAEGSATSTEKSGSGKTEK